MRKTHKLFFIAVLCVFFASVEAAAVDEIKTKIQEKNSQISTLEKEIEQHQKDLQATSKQAQTLQNTIKTLDISRNKLKTDIQITERKVEATSLTLERLGLEIENKEREIGEDIDAIKFTMRQIQRTDDISVVETFLQHEKLTDFWNEIETIESFQRSIQEKVATLKALKIDLASKKSETEKEQNKLKNLNQDLIDQKSIADANQKEKSKILTQTKSQESTYKKLVAEKQALRDAFAEELRSFESELRLAIDPGSFPPAGKGILAWPLDSVFLTQKFGHTEFSKTAAVYNGNGHNGVDFRAAVGTKIKSAGKGVVAGTGNTDTVCPGASYGKWVLVTHTDGLSTLYAHLSLIKVVAGEKVETGQILGYSGDTGYATGPHLHFTVYATQGVRIMERQSRVCGRTYTMPVADLKAYIDPLVYL